MEEKIQLSRQLCGQALGSMRSRSVERKVEILGNLVIESVYLH
jgi:hypothetical protein